MTKLVALTGNIGSGKSYVSTLFSELGVPIFYSDIEAKKMYYKEEIRLAITKRFGSKAYLDNDNINKPFLTSLIFGDPDAASFIEGLLYPALDKHFKEWAETQAKPYVIYESAIIFEKGMENRFDSIIMVTASKATRLRRVMLRDACSKEAVIKRMQKQWNDRRKARLSDYVIKHEQDNEDDYLRQQVAEIHKSLSSFGSTCTAT